MKELKQYPIIMLFASFIISFSIIDLLSSHRDFSEMENRVLAKQPEFTLQTLFDGTYTKDFETYVNDQFIGRDTWITLKSYGEQGLGKIMNNEIVYGKDGYLFDLTLSANQERFEKNIQYLNEFLSMYQDENLFVSFIPNSTTVLQSKLPAGFPGLNQISLLEDIVKDIPTSQQIDLITPLRAHQNEYIYYKTDHHWTTLGAYYAYVALGEALNYEPVSLDLFFEAKVPDFYGTYDAKVKNPAIEPDELTYFEIDGTKTTILDKTYNTMYDTSKFEVRDKYAAYLYGNNGFTRLETETSPERKLLIIKDSYTNSLAPFLTQNYDTIDLIDLRHINLSLKQVIESQEYDDILFLFSVGNFMNEVNIARLRY